MKRCLLLCGLCLCLALSCLLSACSLPASPQTRFGYDPWSHSWVFADTKDNDVELKGFVLRHGEVECTVESLIIRNNASDVRRANVEQIQAYTEQVRAVTGMFEEFSRVLASFRTAPLTTQRTE